MIENQKKVSALSAWLQLLRVPNLLTVPGDPILGYLLAAGVGWALVWNIDWLSLLYCVAASLCLYCAGLIANDLFDLKEDCRDRPTRPLPGGQIKISTAIIVAILLALVGIVAAFLASTTSGIVAVVLAVLIFIYDVGGKRIPFIGPINMGLCRMLSVMLGAGINCPIEEVWRIFPVAGFIGLYVTAVTSIAKKETIRHEIGLIRYVPAGVACFWLLLQFYCGISVLFSGPPEHLASFFIALIAFVWTFKCGWRLRNNPQSSTVQQTIGMLIRGLIPVQAMLIYFYSCVIPPASLITCMWGTIFTSGLFVAWLISAILAKRFYSS